MRAADVVEAEMGFPWLVREGCKLRTAKGNYLMKLMLPSLGSRARAARHLLRE